MLPRVLDRFRFGRWMTDTAFAFADLLRIGTGVRDSLQMCLQLTADSDSPVKPPDGFEFKSFTHSDQCGPIHKARWIELLSRAGFRVSEDTFDTEFIHRHLIALV